VAAAALLATGGCADGQGTYVNSVAAHFTPGVTTRAEVTAKLGPPSSVFDQADGSKTLTWARDGGLFNPDETRGLSIVFGVDGKMVRIAP
jgi:hypothetical protein